MSAGTSNAAFRTLDDADKLRDNDVNPYYLEGLKHRVSVARVGGQLFAFDDIYEGYPLSGGLLTGTTLMSQYDGSQFDIKTGSVLRGPAMAALRTYHVREQNGKIQVQI
jgi:3-phenylpropionate/trans-cinnamate dioxygenase ferredoxin component